MHARVGRLAVVVVGLIATLSSAAPAAAGDNDQLTTNPFINQTSPTRVDVGVRVTDAPMVVSRAGHAGVAPCVYAVLWGDAARQEFLVMFGLDAGEPDPAVRYVFRTCNSGTVDLVATYRIGEPLTQVVVDAMTAAAYDHLEIPVLDPRTAPGGDSAAPFVVNLPTWLWLDAAAWTPIHAEASVPGAQVVATATPITATWEPLPGTSIRCDGPGTAYSFDVVESAQHTSCAFTYAASSASAVQATFELRVTVRWSVQWVCQPACGSGVLPPFEVTSARSVHVAEIQALNTRSR